MAALGPQEVRCRRLGPRPLGAGWLGWAAGHIAWAAAAACRCIPGLVAHPCGPCPGPVPSRTLGAPSW
eukprot:6901322-Alexandrium_andersonii.AAC.1